MIDGEINKKTQYHIDVDLTERQYATLLVGLRMAKDKASSFDEINQEDADLFNFFLKERG